uniref:hypothetical protein n=1 Tax=Lysinibacillus fusiformis TaxID=28031 RepID=UPI0020C0458D
NITYIKDLLHVTEMQQQSTLATGFYEVIVHIQAQRTDHLLQPLLDKNASFKQLIPINDKEKFIQHD